jgi:hypothetical protein
MDCKAEKVCRCQWIMLWWTFIIHFYKSWFHVCQWFFHHGRLVSSCIIMRQADTPGTSARTGIVVMFHDLWQNFGGIKWSSDTSTFWYRNIAMLSGINSSAVFYNIKATTKTPKCLRHMDTPLTNWWAKTEQTRLRWTTLWKNTNIVIKGG